MVSATRSLVKDKPKESLWRHHVLDHDGWHVYESADPPPRKLGEGETGIILEQEYEGGPSKILDCRLPEDCRKKNK